MDLSKLVHPAEQSPPQAQLDNPQPTSTMSTSTTTHSAMDLDPPSSDEDSDIFTSDTAPGYTNPVDISDPRISGLEDIAARGVTVLKEVRKILEDSDVLMGDRDRDWKEEITRVLGYSETARVIIAVVGSTGAGKSSLINSIVDEEKVLATNCMRASTAVATEISYNYGQSKYKAEIEFVKASEWRRELEILVRDLEDNPDGWADGSSMPRDSEAALAMLKMKAVYPGMTGEEMLQASVETLMAVPAVIARLGSKLTIEENNAARFAKMMKSFIDSPTRRSRAAKSKGKDTSSSAGTNEENTMALWPLIRVVRIFVKADALSTGAVLADLPGVFDSNAARVAVAQEYMKKCSAHMIVAPINRAVDDKVAQDLLGENFKMQLQMDCAFHDITFVCTKTDDISVREVQETLQLQLPSTRQREQLKKEVEQIKESIRELHAEANSLHDVMDNNDDEIESLETRLGEEFNVDASEITPKRKRPGLGLDMVGSSDTPLTSPIKDGFDNAPPLGPDPSPSSQDALKEKLIAELEGLKKKRKEMSNRRRELKQTISAKENERNKLLAQSADLEKNLLRECIEARNEYAQQEIKRDFVQSLRDMDEQIYASLQETGDIHAVFRSESEYRDLEESLPVFCVSTKAYQKLRGRHRREPEINGFHKLDETNVPQLQRHCIRLTEQAREASSKRFLIQMHLLIKSMSAWSLAQGSAQIISDDRRQQIEGSFNRTSAWFEKELLTLRTDFIDDLERIVKTNILNHLDDAARHASDRFPEIIMGWNDQFRWNTYRAFCRRQGTYRKRDLNAELANPFMEKILPGWTNTFTAHIPARLEILYDSMRRTAKVFDSRIMRSDSVAKLSDQSREVLKEVLKVSLRAAKTQLSHVKKWVQQEQKEVSRVVVAEIEAQLKATYQSCAEQSGLGTLRRMQAIMSQAAGQQGPFQHSAQRLRERLVQLLAQSKQQLEPVERTLHNLERNYHVVIIAPQMRRVSEEQGQVQAAVMETLQKAERELGLEEALQERNHEDQGVRIKEEPE